jgi:hypothetical protein
MWVTSQLHTQSILLLALKRNLHYDTRVFELQQALQNATMALQNATVVLGQHVA